MCLFFNGSTRISHKLALTVTLKLGLKKVSCLKASLCQNDLVVCTLKQISLKIKSFSFFVVVSQNWHISTVERVKTECHVCVCNIHVYQQQQNSVNE